MGLEMFRTPEFWFAVLGISGLLAGAYFTIRNAVRDGVRDAERELEWEREQRRRH